MMNRTELQVIKDYLESPYGTQESYEALDQVIEMIDQREAMWKARAK